MACAVADCGAPARIRGLCKRHFNSWYKATTRRRVTAIRPRPLTADAILSEDVEPHACTPDCELAWLAGLLEGEGCFSMANAGAHRYPAVRVEMASRDVVERAARLLEAVSVTVAPPTDPRWKLMYVAKIAGARVVPLLLRLRPLMGIRRRAAIDAALAAYKPIRLVDPPATCVVPDCGEPNRSRGLCHRHYMSWSRDVARGRVPRVTPLR